MYIPTEKTLPLNDCTSCPYFKSSQNEAKLLGLASRRIFKASADNSISVKSGKKAGTALRNCNCEQCFYKRWIGMPQKQ